MLFTKLRHFPALFRGPDGEAIVFTVAFPNEPDQTWTYYGDDGRKLNPMVVRAAGWIGDGRDRDIQWLRIQSCDGTGPVRYVERDLEDDCVTIDGVVYEYTPTVDASRLTFVGMSDEEHRLVAGALTP